MHFKYAKWRWLRHHDQVDDQDVQFDAFVSYASDDQEWVDQVLSKSMERPGFKLCLHERDFQVGRSITENIVDCMGKSRYCLIILSHHYIKSNWCIFEAQVAQSLMKDKLTMIVLDKDVVGKSSLANGIKTLIKTRTFIIWDGHDHKFWRRIDDAMSRSSTGLSILNYQ